MSSSALGIGLIVVIGLIALGALIGAVLLVRWAWKSKASPAAQVGAYAGAGCLLFGLAGCPAVMFPVFLQAREAAKRTQCISNLNLISRATQMYAGDNSDRLPLKAWSDPLADYVGDPVTYTCPSLARPFSYTFNVALVGKSMSEIASPATTPLAFDGPGGKDSVGDISLARFRHLDEACVAYLSSEARRHKPGTIPSN